MSVRRLALVGVLALAACDSPVESHEEAELWAALDIRNYEFVYFVGCFCGFTGPNPAKLTVRNGVVVKVEPTGNSIIPPSSVPAGSYPTIDSLFAIVERARVANPATLDVKYDETYHFPKSIFVDPVEGTADDEVTYTVQAFVPATAAASSR
jgi:Family of unknown function (DUF6174)